MQYRLSELADVKLGYQARGRVEFDPQGSYKIIQFKDIDNIEGLKIDEIYTIVPERDVENSLVHAGDILFLSRGSRNIACTVIDQLDYTVAASNIYIVRLKSSILLPEYLAWYINQPAAQAMLKDMAQGVTIQAIKMSAFVDLKISIPPLVIQQSVAQLTRLHQKEQGLTRRLMEKREQLVQAVCQKAVSREFVKEENK